VKQLLEDLASFRDARGWARHHTPRNLAEALSVEAGELLQCYLWSGEFGAPRGNPREELADVLIFALNMALALDVDPEVIVREKMSQNSVKYPVSHG
jgi:dCTP diphosphatase